MTAATEIGIATGEKAQSLYEAKTQSTGLSATGASTSAASFRSSWLSLLATLGSGLGGATGDKAGADAAQSSAGTALGTSAGTPSTASSIPTDAAKLLENTGKTLGSGSVAAAATSVETGSRSSTSAQKTTTEIENQSASRLAEKSTAKTQAAGSASGSHSAKSAKSQTASSGAADQVSAVPGAASQSVLGFAQDSAGATAATAAPASGTANQLASEAAPVVSINFMSQGANPVESGWRGVASSASSPGPLSEVAAPGETRPKGSATEEPLRSSALRGTAQANGASSARATALSSQEPANSGLRSATANQSPAATGPSVSSENEMSSVDQDGAPPAHAPMRAASESQLATLLPVNNSTQSAATETLAATAGGEGAQPSGMVADTAKSPSSSSLAATSSGKKPGPANAGHTSDQSIARIAQQTDAAGTAQRGDLAVAGQSGVSAQNATDPMRDAAYGHGGLVSAGNSAGETAAASGNGSTLRETFSALDAGSTASTPTWIHAGAQRAEAGFQDPALGWIGVRADSSGGSVHAALVAGSADAAQTLSGHLAGLNAYLADQHTAVEAVTVAASEDRSASYSMDQGMNQGAGQDGGRGQLPVPQASVPANPSTLSTVSAARTEASTLSSSPGGSHISVIA